MENQCSFLTGFTMCDYTVCDVTNLKFQLQASYKLES